MKGEQDNGKGGGLGKAHWLMVRHSIYAKEDKVKYRCLNPRNLC